MSAKPKTEPARALDIDAVHHTRHAYSPRADSLPARVIAFFQRNPDEVLTIEDITEKFDVTRGNIHTQLSLADASGQVTRDRDEDGAYIYRAGKHLPKHPDAGVILHPVGKPGRAITAPKAPANPLPSADEIVIEDDVPLPNHKGNVDTDYTGKLTQLKLKLNQSFALPVFAKHTLVKQIGALHKADAQRRYTMRVLKDTQQVRVWRIA